MRTSLLPGLTVALALALAPVALAEDETLTAEIDAVLAANYPMDEPGAVVIVVKDGEPLFRKAYGMANLELDIPLAPDMVFRIGSITKQFTAAAILLLEQQGKLSVQDPITKYLPDYPVHGHEITVEHLLTHTSGIYSYTAIPGYMGNPVRRDLSTEELVDVFTAKPMDFAPGEKWQYNNSGYVLAGFIIEKVSGKSYADFLQEQIFEPLGMKSSSYGGHQLIPKRVSGYSGKSGSYRNADYISMTQPHAAGSLLSSVDDLARWDASLTTFDLLTRSSYQRMTTRYILDNGEPVDYGYGFSLTRLRSWDAVLHGGGIHGFTTFALRVREERLYVAVLTNNPEKQPGPSTMAMTVAALALGDPFPEWTAVDLPREILQRYVGTYELDEQNQRVVTLENGKLYTQRTGGPKVETLAASETTFFYENSLAYFEMILDDEGRVTGMRMHPNGAERGEVSPRLVESTR